MSYLRFDKALMNNLEEALPREILRTNMAMGIVVTVMMWQSHHRRKLLRRREEIIEREQYAVDRLACEARSQGLDPGDTPAPTHRGTIKLTDSI